MKTFSKFAMFVLMSLPFITETHAVRVSAIYVYPWPDNYTKEVHVILPSTIDHDKFISKKVKFDKSGEKGKIVVEENYQDFPLTEPFYVKAIVFPTGEPSYILDCYPGLSVPEQYEAIKLAFSSYESLVGKRLRCDILTRKK